MVWIIVLTIMIMLLNYAILFALFTGAKIADENMAIIKELYADDK